MTWKKWEGACSRPSSRLQQINEYFAGQWSSGSLVFSARLKPAGGEEMADEHAEVMDACEEYARLAEAAAASACTSGNTYTRRCTGELFTWTIAQTSVDSE